MRKRTGCGRVFGQLGPSHGGAINDAFSLMTPDGSGLRYGSSRTAGVMRRFIEVKHCGGLFFERHAYLRGADRPYGKRPEP
jgi:hypothetical protein